MMHCLVVPPLVFLVRQRSKTNSMLHDDMFFWCSCKCVFCMALAIVLNLKVILSSVPRMATYPMRCTAFYSGLDSGTVTKDWLFWFWAYSDPPPLSLSSSLPPSLPPSLTFCQGGLRTCPRRGCDGVSACRFWATASGSWTPGGLSRKGRRWLLQGRRGAQPRGTAKSARVTLRAQTYRPLQFCSPFSPSSPMCPSRA